MSQPSPLSARNNLKHLIHLWKNGQVAPKVTSVYDFLQVPQAMAKLQSRSSIAKIVISLNHLI
ncbi:zinc-binding dehydrogenase [Paraburkholderia sp. MM5482-R1]|uniref:zinc-binding dehydrogenase n=1 Tax=unclassified Paraburkholderia TaxID=2615204 RepID=UPI003D20A51F